MLLIVNIVTIRALSLLQVPRARLFMWCFQQVMEWEVSQLTQPMMLIMNVGTIRALGFLRGPCARLFMWCSIQTMEWEVFKTYTIHNVNHEYWNDTCPECPPGAMCSFAHVVSLENHGM